jgi:hypothetical protein
LIPRDGYMNLIQIADKITRQREEMAIRRDRAEKLRVKLDSKNGLFSVEIDSRGRLMGLRIHGGAHRRMAGTEVSRNIMEVVTSARRAVEDELNRPVSIPSTSRPKSPGAREREEDLSAVLGRIFGPNW